MNTVNSAWKGFLEFEFPRLITKVIGVFGSFLASHLMTLTTTVAYTDFWLRWGMSVPVVTNSALFEQKVGLTITAVWLVIEHLFWRIKDRVNGSNVVPTTTTTVTTSTVTPETTKVIVP